jgi:hypothetical protein
MHVHTSARKRTLTGRHARVRARSGAGTAAAPRTCRGPAGAARPWSAGISGGAATAAQAAGSNGAAARGGVAGGTSRAVRRHGGAAPPAGPGPGPRPRGHQPGSHTCGSNGEGVHAWHGELGLAGCAGCAGDAAFVHQHTIVFEQLCQNNSAGPGYVLHPSTHIPQALRLLGSLPPDSLMARLPADQAAALRALAAASILQPSEASGSGADESGAVPVRHLQVSDLVDAAAWLALPGGGRGLGVPNVLGLLCDASPVQAQQATMAGVPVIALPFSGPSFGTNDASAPLCGVMLRCPLQGP